MKLLVYFLITCVIVAVILFNNNEFMAEKGAAIVEKGLSIVDSNVEKVIKFDAGCDYKTEKANASFVVKDKRSGVYYMNWGGKSVGKTNQEPTYDLNINNGIHVYRMGDLVTPPEGVKNLEYYEICRSPI